MVYRLLRRGSFRLFIRSVYDGGALLVMRTGLSVRVICISAPCRLCRCAESLQVNRCRFSICALVALPHQLRVIYQCHPSEM